MHDKSVETRQKKAFSAILEAFYKPLLAAIVIIIIGLLIGLLMRSFFPDTSFFDFSSQTNEKINTHLSNNFAESLNDHGIIDVVYTGKTFTHSRHKVVFKHLGNTYEEEFSVSFRGHLDPEGYEGDPDYVYINLDIDNPVTFDVSENGKVSLYFRPDPEKSVINYDHHQKFGAMVLESAIDKAESATKRLEKWH